MIKKNTILLSFILIVLTGVAQNTNRHKYAKEGKGRHEFRYTNPITRDTAMSMRDYCIIKVGDKWYCTGTSDPVWTGPNPGVHLLVSNDLIHWKQCCWLIDASKLPPDCPYNGGLGPGDSFYKT